MHEKSLGQSARRATARADLVLMVVALGLAVIGALAVATVVIEGLTGHTTATVLMALAYAAPPVSFIALIALWVRMIAKRRNA